MDVDGLTAKQRLVREKGMCGDAAPDGSRICILAPGHPEPHPWDVTGPLAPLFAQVREALDAEYDGFCAWCQCSVHEQPHASECEGRRALAALSSIERHVQDTEKRAERAEGMIRELHKGYAAIGGGPCICDICAALSVPADQGAREGSQEGEK